MKKAILTSVAISVGAGIIASASYHAGKIVGAVELGIELLKSVKDLGYEYRK